MKPLFLFGFVFLSLISHAQFKFYEHGMEAYKKQDYENAIKNLNEYLDYSLRDKSFDVDVYYYLGLSYFKTASYTSAVRELDHALERGHKNAGNIHWFMAKAYGELRVPKESIASYTKALELIRDNANQSKMLYERSLQYAKLSDAENQKKDLEQSIALNGNQDAVKALAALNKPTEIAMSEQKVIVTSQPADSRAINIPKGDNAQKLAGKTEEQKVNPQPVTQQPVTNPPVTEQKKTETATTKNPIQETAKEPAKDQAKQPADEKKVAQNTTEQKQPENKPEKTAANTKTDVAQQQTTAKVNVPTSTAPVTTTPVTTAPVTQPAATAEPKEPTLAELFKDEKRYALVIGNSDYKFVAPLKNSANDANDMAAELEKSNFEVIKVINGTYDQIREAYRKFQQKLVEGPKDQTIGLFYYAGHGLQNEGENYLVPVEANIKYEDDIPRTCLAIQRVVVANMERSNSRMNIIILDACRNNPFPSAYRSTSSGLTEINRAKGSFVAFATAPGSVASDGDGRNGLYTQELLKAMRKPGRTIEQVFKDVRYNVMKLSGEKQYTWDQSNIIGDFYFKF